MPINTNILSQLATYDGTQLHNGEPVVSEHRLYRTLMDPSLQLYGNEEFKAQALFVNASYITDVLFPSIKKTSEILISNRTQAVIARVKQYQTEYEKIDKAAEVAEVFFDAYFRKGNQNFMPREKMRQKTQKFIDSEVPVQIIIPVLPNKVQSPLKSRGLKPDFGEILLLIRLNELVRVIQKIYPLGAQVTILSDGRRFMRSSSSAVANRSKYF